MHGTLQSNEEDVTVSSVSNRRDKNGLCVCVCVDQRQEIWMLNMSQKLSHWALSEKSKFFPVFQTGLGNILLQLHRFGNKGMECKGQVRGCSLKQVIVQVTPPVPHPNSWFSFIRLGPFREVVICCWCSSGAAMLARSTEEMELVGGVGEEEPRSSEETSNLETASG